MKDQDHNKSKSGHKCSFGAITPFNVVSWNFCQSKRLTGTVLSISENLRAKDQGHQMTKYGQKCSFGAIIYAHYKGGLLRLIYDLGILSQSAGGGIPSTL